MSFLRKRHIFILILLLIFSWLFFFPYIIKEPLTSTVINSREGVLLSATIAADGQWRFPPTGSVPNKLETCLLQFEDEYFYYHPGINPFSVGRAIWQNMTTDEVVSGASTITMQLARMLRQRERTYLQKLIEMILALRLEFTYSKPEIMRFYASMAPFGGNVVGINAASWRYYGRASHTLSWAESATLAVLPNDPGAIFPGRGTNVLLRKRNFLLKKLLSSKQIDSLTYELSLSEPLPDKPFDIPQKSFHLLTTLLPSYKGQLIQTTIQSDWQENAVRVIGHHHTIQKNNGVDNLAAMVVNLHDGKVLAYVGNTNDQGVDGHFVDIIHRPRSSGSILKPILYTSALDRGLILPNTLLNDVPSFFGGYSPKNFNLGYEGMINANTALSKSLNIPFTYLLKDYTYEQFHQDLSDYGITTLTNSPGRYGLSLILGGAEVKLWDLAQVYFSMYRKLALENNLEISVTNTPKRFEDLPMEEINIWHTFNAMTELSRASDASWKNFSSSQRIAWKTGTSFGFRDAWAVGMNGEVLIAVWVGNADGEGRAGLIGASAAGPILNELIRFSAYNPGWLTNLQPMGIERSVCGVSGMLSSESCPYNITMTLGKNGEKVGTCIYHKSLWVDSSGQFLVNRSCYPSGKSRQKTFFILPPKQGYYYQKQHAGYTGKPKALDECQVYANNPLEINYPNPGSTIFIPRELDDTYGEVILEASHQNPESKIFWHLNDAYIGQTVGEHKLALKLNRGTYVIGIIDDDGNAKSVTFEVVSNLEG
ncbi:MAG: penicillin-binding protein 1C [Marinoscillum sp.]